MQVSTRPFPLYRCAFVRPLLRPLGALLTSLLLLPPRTCATPAAQLGPALVTTTTLPASVQQAAELDAVATSLAAPAALSESAQRVTEASSPTPSSVPTWTTPAPEDSEGFFQDSRGRRSVASEFGSSGTSDREESEDESSESDAEDDDGGSTLPGWPDRFVLWFGSGQDDLDLFWYGNELEEDFVRGKRSQRFLRTLQKERPAAYRTGFGQVFALQDYNLLDVRIMVGPMQESSAEADMFEINFENAFKSSVQLVVLGPDDDSGELVDLDLGQTIGAGENIVMTTQPGYVFELHATGAFEKAVGKVEILDRELAEMSIPTKREKASEKVAEVVSPQETNEDVGTVKYVDPDTGEILFIKRPIPADSVPEVIDEPPPGEEATISDGMPLGEDL